MSDKLQEAEAKIAKLRKALIGLVGASTMEEFELTKKMLETSKAPEAYKKPVLYAIDVLIETE